MYGWKVWTLSFLALSLTLVSTSAGGDKKTGFIDRVYKGPEGESKYVVFVPSEYDGKKDFPLILFLHGAGETGTDGVKQTTVGIGPAIKKQGEKKFGFIVVMPQAHTKGWQADGPNGKRALAILDEVMKTYKVDSKRVYLTGLSMGGFGTWSLALAHPEKWAAIAPICGRGDPKQAAKIKDLPCWCFHGDADKAVPVQNSRDMIDALKKAGGKPRYDEYAGVGHNSWDRAYGSVELYAWLLKHKTK